MYGLPTNTEINKRLAKTQVFSVCDVSSAKQEVFDADISRMVITHSLTTNTLTGISDSPDVKSIYVLKVLLKRREYNQKKIKTLFKLINQNMVLALHYEDRVQFVAFYEKLHFSAWINEQDANLPLQGTNLSVVWENIVRFIGNLTADTSVSLSDQITEDSRKEELQKQIDKLTIQMRKEKQPHRKAELHKQIVNLKKEL